jgi:hypothetical protein
MLSIVSRTMRQLPVSFMKRIVIARLSLFLCVLLVGVSCRSGVVVRHPAPGSSSAKGLPPGQAKKVYGYQSAKAFAPGQQKKNRVQVSSQGKENNKYKKSKKKK